MLVNIGGVLTIAASLIIGYTLGTWCTIYILGHLEDPEDYPGYEETGLSREAWERLTPEQRIAWHKEAEG